MGHSSHRPPRLLQGLGKTLQTVAFLSYLKNERGLAGPSLVVVPLSVMSSWCAELARWAPGLRVVRLHTNDDGERKRMRQEVRWLLHPHAWDTVHAMRLCLTGVRCLLHLHGWGAVPAVPLCLTGRGRANAHRHELCVHGSYLVLNLQTCARAQNYFSLSSRLLSCVHLLHAGAERPQQV